MTYGLRSASASCGARWLIRGCLVPCVRIRESQLAIIINFAGISNVLRRRHGPLYCQEGASEDVKGTGRNGHCSLRRIRARSERKGPGLRIPKAPKRQRKRCAFGYVKEPAILEGKASILQISG